MSELTQEIKESELGAYYFMWGEGLVEVFGFGEIELLKTKPIGYIGMAAGPLTSFLFVFMFVFKTVTGQVDYGPEPMWYHPLLFVFAGLFAGYTLGALMNTISVVVAYLFIKFNLIVSIVLLALTIFSFFNDGSNWGHLFGICDIISIIGGHSFLTEWICTIAFLATTQISLS